MPPVRRGGKALCLLNADLEVAGYVGPPGSASAPSLVAYGEQRPGEDPLEREERIEGVRDRIEEPVAPFGPNVVEAGEAGDDHHEEAVVKEPQRMHLQEQGQVHEADEEQEEAEVTEAEGDDGDHPVALAVAGEHELCEAEPLHD